MNLITTIVLLAIGGYLLLHMSSTAAASGTPTSTGSAPAAASTSSGVDYATAPASSLAPPVSTIIPPATIQAAVNANPQASFTPYQFSTLIPLATDQNGNLVIPVSVQTNAGTVTTGVPITQVPVAEGLNAAFNFLEGVSQPPLGSTPIRTDLQWWMTYHTFSITPPTPSTADNTSMDLGSWWTKYQPYLIASVGVVPSSSGVAGLVPSSSGVAGLRGFWT